ncbi:tRNA (adenosine(37)-N6)-threonylcarbamoyltransferase complex dimerization subunit type 1 TsaB [Microvirga sp. W0021]|uniref:tRNA (Adenosine(37)-N6)-threonylcarbamoyltransferase complex dimerization subunit type 1 TsaB n=1 Tax=Hohaiivirga grylli TaxID=3133970 RepID=A0ABV0BGS1_9HYPH
MRVLAIDTALGACAAGVLDTETGQMLASESLEMVRGHAEALLPLIDRVMSQVQGGFESLNRIAVTVGPGSYTGLRVGISAARAIGLASKHPVVGVTTLSALLAPLISAQNRGIVAAAVDARHGHLYFQAVSASGRPIVAPSFMNTRDAMRQIGAGPAILVGSGAPLLAAIAASQGIEILSVDPIVAPDIAWVAQLGAIADPAQAMPRPLYLRNPDAQPQDHAKLARQ